MNLEAIPLVLLVLLPGFLCIYTCFLVGTFRRLSAFHASAWSLLTSFVLIAITYGVYVLIVDPPPGNEPWPGLFQVLENPALVPGQVWAILYALALLSGISLGAIERRGWIGRLFLTLGIDLAKRDDIWSRAFKNEDFVQVHLKDGTLLGGWPGLYSTDRSHPGPELYLTEAKIWSVETSEWLDLEGVNGILLHGDEISRIEFLTSVYGDEEVASA